MKTYKELLEMPPKRKNVTSGDEVQMARDWKSGRVAGKRGKPATPEKYAYPDEYMGGYKEGQDSI